MELYIYRYRSRSIATDRQICIHRSVAADLLDCRYGYKYKYSFTFPDKDKDP